MTAQLRFPNMLERLLNLERMGDRIGEYFFSMEVGRGSRGDVLLGNTLLAFRTSVGETSESVERDASENFLGGKDEVDDEARVLAIFEMKKVLNEVTRD